MARREWAVAYYRRRPRQRGKLIIYDGGMAYYRKRRRYLYESWKAANKYAQRSRGDRNWIAIVYRIGHKPKRVWTLTIN